MHFLGAASESWARRASEAYATDQRAGKPEPKRNAGTIRPFTFVDDGWRAIGLTAKRAWQIQQGTLDFVDIAPAPPV
jgi:hypothetical protein